MPGAAQQKTVLVDLGFCGVDAEESSVHLIHRGKHKTLTRTQRRWLKGQTGDALHAVLCAAGYNLRWLLRAIVRLGLRPIFFILASLHWLVNVTPHPLLLHRARFRRSLYCHERSKDLFIGNRTFSQAVVADSKWFCYNEIYDTKRLFHVTGFVRGFIERLNCRRGRSEGIVKLMGRSHKMGR